MPPSADSRSPAPRQHHARHLAHPEPGPDAETETSERLEEGEPARVVQGDADLPRDPRARAASLAPNERGAGNSKPSPPKSSPHRIRGIVIAACPRTGPSSETKTGERSSQRPARSEREALPSACLSRSRDVLGVVTPVSEDGRSGLSPDPTPRRTSESAPNSSGIVRTVMSRVSSTDRTSARAPERPSRTCATSESSRSEPRVLELLDPRVPPPPAPVLFLRPSRPTLASAANLVLSNICSLS